MEKSKRFDFGKKGKEGANAHQGGVATNQTAIQDKGATCELLKTGAQRGLTTSS